ncbi:hypothetical protein GCM10010293_36730 [Streptomyces griseoflavus]|uniref:DUF6907 domain-containing protein n=1 Tax=Streptomyces griseoflavus TaxID=35619 RepID=UPI00167D2FBD|nr:hypothetical protein [Streptomyces griseoflavus]GGV34318.1 hypothetical protein GCM10010293_36730 [Streptomyces griseoflavus]
MSEPRTVTLPTTDHGDVTVPEPSWCIGHADHRPELRADILHRGADVPLTFRAHHIMDAGLVQAPFSTVEIPELCSSTTGVSISAIARTLDARGVYELAAALDTYADRLRSLADQLLVVLAEGDL